MMIRMTMGVTALLMMGAAAVAQDSKDSRTVAGHAVSIVEGADFLQVLQVDGKDMHSDGLILLDQEFAVGGVPVLTGVSGSGGNACDAAPFVLVLPEGQPARLDGPIDTCSYMELTPGEAGLEWAAEPLPDMPGEVWRWTPDAGFAKGEATAFAPDATEGWGDLAALKGAHPVDALKLAPVYAELTQGMSAADWNSYSAILSGLGSGDLTAQGYRGEACTKLICDSEYAVLWLDQASEQAFAFWVQDGQEPRSYPADTGAWPQWVLEDLSARVGAAN